MQCAYLNRWCRARYSRDPPLYALRAEDPGISPGAFRLLLIRELHNCTLIATLPGPWRYRASAVSALSGARRYRTSAVSALSGARCQALQGQCCDCFVRCQALQGQCCECFVRRQVPGVTGPVL